MFIQNSLSNHSYYDLTKITKGSYMMGFLNHKRNIRNQTKKKIFSSYSYFYGNERRLNIFSLIVFILLFSIRLNFILSSNNWWFSMHQATLQFVVLFTVNSVQQTLVNLAGQWLTVPTECLFFLPKFALIMVARHLRKSVISGRFFCPQKLPKCYIL